VVSKQLDKLSAIVNYIVNNFLLARLGQREIVFFACLFAARCGEALS
jgi:hypothetical protein